MEICLDLRKCVASIGFHNVGGLGRSDRHPRPRRAHA